MEHDHLKRNISEVGLHTLFYLSLTITKHSAEVTLLLKSLLTL
jgi:hypothetical protein